MPKKINELYITAGFATNSAGAWPLSTPITPELEKLVALVVNGCKDAINSGNIFDSSDTLLDRYLNDLYKDIAQ